MRLRPRYPLGFLMVAVLVVGLVCWVAIPLLIPVSPAERQAQSAYEQALLHRELAEYAVREFEHGVAPPGPTVQTLPLDAATDASLISLQARREQILREMRHDVRKAHAVEQLKRAVYRAERSRRLGIYAR